MSQKPVDVLRDANLKAGIWRNEGEHGAYYSASLSRTYKDQNGEYRDAQTFSQGDLLRVSELARSAYNRIHDLRQEHGKSHAPEATPERAAAPDTRREDFIDKRQESAKNRPERTPEHTQ